jgi:hypothetical protein
LPPFCLFLCEISISKGCFVKFASLKEIFLDIMEEIPVEYNIIIEALNCVVQNQQQALEQAGGQAAFECVVNTSEHVVQPPEQGDGAPQQTVFQCVVDTSEGQPVSYEVTGKLMVKRHWCISARPFK